MNKHAELLNCCICKLWKPIGGDRVAANNGYCRFNAPATILPHQLSRKDISERNKFELRERAVPPRVFELIHSITNSLWICAQVKRLKTKR